MKKFSLLLAILAFLGLQVTFAQTREISGVVTSSDDGSTIPGASVVVKGTTVGIITDMDGKFSLKVPQDATTLVVSFVGMQSQEVAITSESSYQVALQSENIAVDEVVVTALGISREKKSLGYAVQEVGGEDINSNKSDNFATALSGRVSGLQVKNNTNFGGSTNVIIRGSSSLTQSNQALFVVDGVPINNDNTNNSGQTTGRSGYDYGNTAADINSNDIESVSVLKGAAATALYGSRAANGVILITTKKGKEGSKTLGVNVNSNVTVGVMDKSTFPEYQNQYGAGYDPYWYSHPDYPGMDGEDVNGDGIMDIVTPYYEDAARGQKFDPSMMVYQWDAFDPESPNYMTPTPYVATQNGAETFFENAVSYTNSVDVNGGSEKSTYRFAYTNMDQSGIMPNSSLKRNNFNFSGSYNILDNLKISTLANYIHTNGKGRPSTGYSDNIMSSFRQWWQVNVDVQMLKKLYEETGRNITWNRKYYDNPQPAYWDNPYWVRHENYEQDQRSRLIGYAKLDWEINDKFSVMGRVAVDTYNELQEEHKAVGSVAGEFGVGRPDVTSGYSRFTKAFTETNSDLMLNYHERISEGIDLTAFIGTNIRRTRIDQVFASTNGGLAVAGLYALSNSVDPMLPPEEKITEIGVNGLFASASLGFENTLYVDATIRRDQSSTLPSEHNTYYYPSITTSFIFSNLIEADWLNLLKGRLNYAEVGNSAPALKVVDTYRGNAPFSGNSMVTCHYIKNNPNLKPERQKAIEAGVEMSILQNRLGVDLAAYKNNTFDQLMPVSVSWATGYRDKWVNAGEIENSGVEIAFFGTPVRTKDFSWNVNVNWSKNANKVVSLFTDEAGNEVTNLQLASLQGGITINARVGEAYGTIHGSDYTYHENGGKIVGGDGYYVKSSKNDIVLGNFNPDWMGGISNTFRYKNLSTSFLVDVQKGGDVFSLDLWYGMGTGLYKETAELNDLGNPERDDVTNDANSGGIIYEGVDENGNPNTTRIASDIFADGWVTSPNKRFVYDASYVKLRELSVSYDFPVTSSSSFIKGATLSFVGSNLWIIHKNLPYADPEASQGSGNIQGWQSGVMPTTRNFGFNVNLKF